MTQAEAQTDRQVPAVRYRDQSLIRIRSAADMTTVEDATALRPPSRSSGAFSTARDPRPASGAGSRPSTTRRSRILYGTTAMLFFLVGGVEALLIRVQLAQPERHGALGGPVQPVLHDARHHHDLPHGHAARRRVRQLPDPADDRRARRRVPAHQHVRVLGVPASAGCSSTRLHPRRRARTAVGSVTRRSPAHRCRRASYPVSGADFWAVGLIMLGIGSVDVRGQLHRHRAQHARARHDA